MRHMVLLVVGASSDLGMATIRTIGKNYDHILAHYRNMNDKLQALKNTEGYRLQLLRADLSSESEVRGLIRGIEASGNLPTHIVHFPAQKIMLRRFQKTPWDVFQQGLDVSLRSLALVCQAFLPRMAKQGKGKIVAILSAAVEGIPPKYSADYVVAKYAMLGLIKALAVEYEDKGITVNGISPEYIETKFVTELPEAIRDNIKASSANGSVLVPDDIVPYIARLLAEDGDPINGQNIIIPCGRL